MDKMNKPDSSAPVEMTLQEYADTHGISYGSALYRKKHAKIEASVVIVDERVKYKDEIEKKHKENDDHMLYGEMTLQEYADACHISLVAASNRRRERLINPNIIIVRDDSEKRGIDYSTICGKKTLKEYAAALGITYEAALYRKMAGYILPNVTIIDESEKNRQIKEEND